MKNFLKSIVSSVKKRSFILILMTATSPLLLLAKSTDMSFTLSDEEIKAFNLNEAETQELRQFFDVLNNLPAEDRQKIKEESEKIEQKMRDAKLDPTNVDDLVKFMEAEEKKAAGKIEPVPFEKPLEIETPTEKKLTFIPAVNPKDTLSLLKDIERKIDSLLVKAKSREALNKKLSTMQQEIIEFRYFIITLQDPELVILLASKDFVKLHKNLETLQKALATHEPSIIARKRGAINDDDPYELLDVEYDATPERITQAYKKLKAAKSPEAMAKAFKKQGISEKDGKKRLKEARLSWSFIQDAYDTLQDPNERALVRKELKTKIDQEARHEQASKTAFNAVFDALTTAFYPHAVLKDIQALLEKYKPQELEKAKKQLEVEKKATERAKQVTSSRIEATPHRPGAERAPYEEFYQKIGFEPRPTYPMPQPTGPASGEKAGPGRKDEMEKGGAKPEGKKDGKKEEKKDEKKDGKGEKKEEKKEAGKIDKKDLEKYAALDAIERILKAAAKKTTITFTNGAGVAAQLTFDAIITNLEADLRAATPQDDGIKQLKQYVDEVELDGLFEALKKLAPEPKKKVLSADQASHDDLSKEWVKRIWEPYNYLIETWYNGIYGHIGKLRAAKRLLPWNQPKAKIYKLDTAEPTHDLILSKKWKKSDPAGTPINLAAVRDLMLGTNLYYTAINQACAAQMKGKKPKPAPVVKPTPAAGAPHGIPGTPLAPAAGSPALPARGAPAIGAAGAALPARRTGPALPPAGASPVGTVPGGATAASDEDAEEDDES